MFLDTADPGGSGKFWIGLTDLFQEGNFVWSNGDKSTYRNWAKGEPNNGYLHHEHFGLIETAVIYQRKWNDNPNVDPAFPAMALCQFVL